MKIIGIVIINFNSSEDTIDCLNSLYKVESGGYKLFVVVIDNGSIQDDYVKIEIYLSEIKKDIQKNRKDIEFVLIRNKDNKGFSEGNNTGIKYVLEKGAEYVILLNNDTIIDKDFLSEIIKVLKLDEKTGIVSPKIYFAKNREFHKDRYSKDQKGRVIWYAGGIMDWKNVIGSHMGVDEVDNGQYKTIAEADFATGCCMLIRKNVFEKIGYFDSRYFLYYEDNDISQRARQAGYKIMFAPDAVIWHKNAGSAGGSGSTLQDYYITRNRLLFGFKYAPLRSKVSLFKQSFILLFMGRKYQKRGIIDFYLSKFGKGSYDI